MIWPARAIGYCDEMPKRYGLAWDRPHRAECVILPVPINVVARLLYLSWIWVKYPMLAREWKWYEKGRRDWLARESGEDRDRA